jgi:hypothetical protein
MVILIVMVILCTSYAVTKRMLAGQETGPPTPMPPRPSQVRAEPSRAQLEAGRPDPAAWSALDDHQLTRLLTSAARRTTNE